jgi:methylated-DNA-[protein]-cysteine S-methyltransferase
MHFAYHRIESPIGTILAVTNGSALHALDFHDYVDRMRRLLQVHYGAVELAEAPDGLDLRARLGRYFAGDFSAFDGLPLLTNGTPFQRSVWDALLKIPVGTTTSYGALARSLGDVKTTRAVGLANGANPIAIVVPCHRVIGADGTLTGYGGGLHRKAWLLRHEGVALPGALQTSFAFDAAT